MATPINKILTNQQQDFSPEELANVSASLSAILGQGGGGGGGEPCASAWLPSVDENGNLSWTLSMSTTTPGSANIMGPQGPSGTSGAKGEDGTSVIVKSIREFNDTVGSHTKGGTEVTLEWTEDDTVKTSAFSAFNGEKGQDGAGASYTFDSVTMSGDGDIDPLGVDTNVIATQAWVGEQGYLTSVPDTYATKTYANEASAYALSQAQSWVGQQGYLTSVPDSYATKTYANEASAYALSQAQSWVGDQGFIKSTDLTDYATKSYANDASAAALTQAESWVESQNYLKSVLVAADGSLAGSGTTNSPLALKTSAENAIKTVSAKSNVDITSAGVTTVTNTSGTTINKFTQYGEVAYHPTPKMFLCATADSQADIVNVLGAASGMGAVVFVVQSI